MPNRPRVTCASTAQDQHPTSSTEAGTTVQSEASTTSLGFYSSERTQYVDGVLHASVSITLPVGCVGHLSGLISWKYRRYKLLLDTAEPFC